jgi:PAS domain S-box-containing protein
LSEDSPEQLDAPLPQDRILDFSLSIPEQDPLWVGRHQVETYHGALIALSRQIPFLADSNGNLLCIAPAWTEMTGLPVEGSRGHGFFAAYHPEDRDSLIAAWQSALTYGSRFDRQSRVRRVDGHYGWARIRAVRLPQVGTEEQWFGTIEDTDVEHRLHDEALAAEQRYRLASRATHDLIWDHDLAADRLHFGEAMSTVFGYGPTQPVTLRWWMNIIHPADRARVEQSYHAACESTQDVWLCEYRLRRADDGYAPVSDCGFIVRDEQGNAIRVVARCAISAPSGRRSSGWASSRRS